jgi:hypothetical protein
MADHAPRPIRSISRRHFLRAVGVAGTAAREGRPEPHPDRSQEGLARPIHVVDGQVQKDAPATADGHAPA